MSGWRPAMVVGIFRHSMAFIQVLRALLVTVLLVGCDSKRQDEPPADGAVTPPIDASVPDAGPDAGSLDAAPAQLAPEAGMGAIDSAVRPADAGPAEVPPMSPDAAQPPPDTTPLPRNDGGIVTDATPAPADSRGQDIAESDTSEGVVTAVMDVRFLQVMVMAGSLRLELSSSDCDVRAGDRLSFTTPAMPGCQMVQFKVLRTAASCAASCY